MSADLLEQLVAARFDALLDAAAAGTPLLLRARRPDTLDRLVARARSGPLLLEPIEAPAGPGTPADRLLLAGGALGVAADDLAGLIAAPGLHYALLVARVAEGEGSAWATVAGVFASLRRARGGSGPALVVVTDDPRCPAGCRAFDDGVLFGPAESALLARFRRPDRGLIAEAADAAAIEVARGDPALLAQLLELGDAERLDPSGWIACQAPGPSPSPLPWRGAEAACPIWLGRHDRAGLRRRVWRGHLSVLLPWLEDVRAAFLLRAAALLPTGQRDGITGEPVSPEDYEWGHIVTALRTRRDPLADVADLLRRVRNALAHGDPAMLEDCRRLEGAARRLLAWR